MDILARYYTYDPRCMINMKWNGTDCVVDFDTYCASLTEEYRALRNDSRIEVYYLEVRAVSSSTRLSSQRMVAPTVPIILLQIALRTRPRRLMVLVPMRLRIWSTFRIEISKNSG